MISPFRGNPWVLFVLYLSMSLSFSFLPIIYPRQNLWIWLWHIEVHSLLSSTQNRSPWLLQILRQLSFLLNSSGQFHIADLCHSPKSFALLLSMTCVIRWYSVVVVSSDLIFKKKNLPLSFTLMNAILKASNTDLVFFIYILWGLHIPIWLFSPFLVCMPQRLGTS